MSSVVRLSTLIKSSDSGFGKTGLNWYHLYVCNHTTAYISIFFIHCTLLFSIRRQENFYITCRNACKTTRLESISRIEFKRPADVDGMNFESFLIYIMFKQSEGVGSLMIYLTGPSFLVPKISCQKFHIGS